MPQVQTKSVGFTAIEPFATVKLDDGNTIKVKLVMNKVLRVLDPQGQPAFGPDGKPWYEIQMAPHIVVETPEDQAEMREVTQPAAPPPGG